MKMKLRCFVNDQQTQFSDLLSSNVFMTQCRFSVWSNVISDKETAVQSLTVSQQRSSNTGCCRSFNVITFLITSTNQLIVESCLSGAAFSVEEEHIWLCV